MQLIGDATCQESNGSQAKIGDRWRIDCEENIMKKAFVKLLSGLVAILFPKGVALTPMKLPLLLLVSAIKDI